MKRVFAVVLGMLVVVYGCSSSTGTDDSDEGTVVIATVSIGPSGGTLESDILTVEVPAGSFASDVDLTLWESSEDFNNDTTTWSLSGIPTDYDGALNLKMALSGDAPDTPVIAIGENTFPQSAGEQTISWRLIDASVIDSSLVAVLPPPNNTSGVARIAASDQGAEQMTLLLASPRDYAPVLSSNGHFRIHYPRFSVNTLQATQLADALEEAWNDIAAIGFSYAERSKWPVEVTVKQLPQDTDGLATCSAWGDNSSYIEIAAAVMGDGDRLRRTAYHEFFHLVQSLYDPRWAISKAKTRSPYLWLDEASSTWIEEKSATDPASYKPGNLFLGNFMEVLDGPWKRDKAKEEQNYGYGMAAAVKYLTGRYNESCVAEMYQQIADGADAVTATGLATEPFIEWWESFLRAYVTGGVYDRGHQNFLTNAAATFTIITESDSLAEWTSDYRDLSAKVYSVKPVDAYIPPGTTLTCSVSGSMSEVSVFTWDNSGVVVFTGTSTESVTVPGLREVVDNKGGVLVLVTNSRAISPYDTRSPITLTVKVDRPSDIPAFTEFSLSAQLKGLFTDSRGKSYSDLITGPPFGSFGTGSMAGNSFTAEWDRTVSEGHFSGSILIIFNDDRSAISSFSGEFIVEYPAYSEKYIGALTGGTVPLYETSGNSSYYRLTGDAVCNGVTVMQYRGETIGSDFWREATAIDCDSYDYNGVYFTMK